MMPTRSFIDCCRSDWIVYGFSPPSTSKGASALVCAAFTSASSTAGRVAPSEFAYAVAASPARLPKTSRSPSELPPSRLEPCMPPEHSPTAYRPVTALSWVSASTSTPPIT